MRPVVVRDVDGTLVDTNYHRALGMGGDRLVAEVAGDGVERSHGDAVRERWKSEYTATTAEDASASKPDPELLEAAGAAGVYTDLTELRERLEEWLPS